MPLNASGWTSDEDEQLAELVRPHTLLYNVQDPSRKNILERESTWKDIGHILSKPVEECKKRWKGLRDGYMRSKKSGTMHKTKVSIHEKLQFLDEVEETSDDISNSDATVLVVCNDLETEQKYDFNSPIVEVTVVDTPTENNPINTLIKNEPKQKYMNRVIKNKPGRKRSTPMPRNIPPVKILPKPVINGPGTIKLQGSEVVGYRMGNLIDKVLKESTDEIEVFFKSMAASVKKLHPKLIPRVKMEVCNVVAKYEMQNYTAKKFYG